jgi:hypothetical protein
LANVIPASGILVRGAFDFWSDWDTYDIDLSKSQTLTVIARSILGDPLITLWDETGTAPVAEGDDSGGGLGGKDAEMVAVAPVTGTYTIVVSDPSFSAGAEYELTLTLMVPDGAKGVLSMH